MSQESFLPLPSKRRGAHLEVLLTSGDTPLKGAPCCDQPRVPCCSFFQSLMVSPPLAVRFAPHIGRQFLRGRSQKERGSGTSLRKAEGSQGEVRLLSTNPAPPPATDNQTRQGYI